MNTTNHEVRSDRPRQITLPMMVKVATKVEHRKAILGHHINQMLQAGGYPPNAVDVTHDSHGRFYLSPNKKHVRNPDVQHDMIELAIAVVRNLDSRARDQMMGLMRTGFSHLLSPRAMEFLK